ncbi:MAG: type IV pilus assembly protein PilM [Acidimicrobiales bacterium]
MAQRIVGLDIGTSAIRAVELSVEDGSRPVLLAYGQVGLQPNAIVDGEVQDRSQVVHALQRLWQEGGFKERRVRLGVAGLRAITREVDMPPVPPDELNEAVLFQSDDVVPFPLEQTALSAKVIATFTDPDGAPTIRVLVAAAHRDLIDGIVKAVTEAGLEPTGIDLDTAALARALHDPSFEGRPEAIVSVGAGLTMVVVHQDAQLQFVRTIDLGGANITAAIAGALDLPMVDSEAIKRQLGADGGNDSRAVSATAEVVTELVDEIQSSIRFFSSLPGRSSPERILVTGAGAQVAGFMDTLQNGFNVPVLAAAPLSLIDTSHLQIPEEQAEAINQTLAVPVGLALPDPSGEHFNLLPPEVVEERERRRILRGLAACGVAVLLLLLAGTAWRIVSVRTAKNNVTSLQNQLTFINKVEIPKYDKAVALSKQVKALQAKYAPLVASEVDWLVVLNQFGEYLPSNAVLASLTMTVSNLPGEPKSSTSKSKRSAKTSSTVAVIGTGSATVNVPNLTALPSFGNSMNHSPALTLGPLSGSLATGSQVSFTLTFTINQHAGSRRLGLYTQSAT